MTPRYSLGWASLALVVLGAVLLLLLWASGVPSGAALAVSLGAAAVAAVLAIIGGACSWRTGPGKAAVIVCIILLAVGVVVFAGLMYLAWAFARMG